MTGTTAFRRFKFASDRWLAASPEGSRRNSVFEAFLGSILDKAAQWTWRCTTIDGRKADRDNSRRTAIPVISARARVID
jgi:hypothetical protein